MKIQIVGAATAAALLITGAPMTKAFAADPSQRAALSTTTEELSKGSQREIEATMADILTQVIDKDFEGTVDNFTKVDRDRIGRLSESTPGMIKSLVKDLRENWQSKYNQAMNIKGATIPYQISRAKVEKTVTVVLPGVDSVPAVTMSFVDEGTLTSKWRMDVPDITSNSSLKLGLELALQKFNQNKANWPANEKEAYREFALRIFSVLNGNPV